MQIEQHFAHDISQVLPILHGLRTTLRTAQATTLPMVKSFKEFSEVISDIHASLEDVRKYTIGLIYSIFLKIFLERNSTNSNLPELGTVEEHSMSVSHSNIHSESVKRKNIRAPSPEKKQKRKKSYKVM